ncbi:MAG: hypothetical protein ACR2NM_11115 [Bythopirellula sp.]
MPRSVVARLLVATAALFCGCAANNEAEVLQVTADQHWYRGNLHTHSHWSDGDDYLEMIALWYRDHGYQFLVFTDHNVLGNTERWIEVEASKGGLAAFEKLKARFPGQVRERTSAEGKLEVRLRTFQEVANQFNEPEKFELIQGEEISDEFEKLPIHLCAGNLVDLIPPMKGGSVTETIQNNVRAVIVQREKTGQPMIVHVNHPNFGFAITAEDLMRVRGERFFEVYNGHPKVANSGDHRHAGMDRVWDIILTRRLAELSLPLMYGLAVDDGHDYHVESTHKSNPGRGWVMVLSKQLSAGALIEALEAGRFYASSGVAMRSVAITPEGLAVEIEPVSGETYITEFIGTRQGYDKQSKPVLDDEGNEIQATRIYSADIGETFKTVTGNRAAYEFRGDEIYVRARVTSSARQPNPGEPGDLQRAWIQPILGPVLAEGSSESVTAL